MSRHLRIARRPLRCEPPAGVDPLLARLLAARGVADARELEYSLRRLPPPDRLGNVEEAAALLLQAIRRQRKVMVVGDFDADGATSCAVALRGLRSLGAERVEYLVPDRFRLGYGLSPALVRVARERGAELLLTVDNGISSLEGVMEARRLGMQVVVTDHHLPGERLPEADAIVNPNLPGDPFPSRNLAGVGVLFYLLLALRARMRREGAFPDGGEPNLAELLDLVALGTVADVVPLDHANRTLVQQGLARIRAGRCVPGILALLEAAGRDHRQVTAADLGFAVGPRLNAAGRLEEMGQGIDCLLAESPEEARPLALELDRLNRERREIEAEMKEQAMSALEALHLEGEGTLPHGLCLFDPQWHQGVVGILASRVKERYHRPVIAFAPGEGGELKGSGRSIAGFHMRDALARVASREPGLVTRFGGHAMAAGLTLPAGHLAPFRDAFEAVAGEWLEASDLEGILLTDGELPPSALDLETAERLRAAGPWGQGFPEPLFDGPFTILERRVVGGRHVKMQVRPVGGREGVDAIAFNALENGWPWEEREVRIAYRLEVNEFRGVRSAQLVVVYMERLS